MEHTLSAIDEDLALLTREVTDLGEAAVTQVRAAVDVFLRHDVDAAATVVAGDAALDQQDIEIEKRAIRFIALRQPMADDLRRPIAAMKMAMQLERCGDLAKNVAKRVAVMEGKPGAAEAKAVGELGALACDRLATVVDAFRREDAQGAMEVWVKDTEVDARHDEVLRGILTGMSADPSTISVSTHLLFIAKNLERIGDHATNIAELVFYQLTGADLADRPKL